MIVTSQERNNDISYNVSTQILEAALRHRGISSFTVHLHTSDLVNVRALDLSYNKIDALPWSLPNCLVALNLSQNCFCQVSIKFKPSFKLIELNLSFNQIERMGDLGILTNLEQLNLSNNKIKAVEGIESLINLKSLLLKNNEITHAMSLRALSCNTVLENLDCTGNPVISAKDYKGSIRNFCSSLITLDKELFRNNSKLISRKPTNNAIQAPKSSLNNIPAMSMIGSSNTRDTTFLSGYCQQFETKQKLTQTGYLHEYNDTLTHHSYHNINESIIFENDVTAFCDASGKAGNDYGPSSVVPAVASPEVEVYTSSLPWRRPPNPVPRPLKFSKQQPPDVKPTGDLPTDSNLQDTNTTNLINIEKIAIDKNSPYKTKDNREPGAQRQNSPRILAIQEQPRRATPSKEWSSNSKWMTPNLKQHMYDIQSRVTSPNITYHQPYSYLQDLALDYQNQYPNEEFPLSNKNEQQSSPVSFGISPQNLYSNENFNSHCNYTQNQEEAFISSSSPPTKGFQMHKHDTKSSILRAAHNRAVIKEIMAVEDSEREVVCLLPASSFAKSKPRIRSPSPVERSDSNKYSTHLYPGPPDSRASSNPTATQPQSKGSAYSMLRQIQTLINSNNPESNLTANEDDREGYKGLPMSINDIRLGEKLTRDERARSESPTADLILQNYSPADRSRIIKPGNQRYASFTSSPSPPKRTDELDSDRSINQSSTCCSSTTPTTTGAVTGLTVMPLSALNARMTAVNEERKFLTPNLSLNAAAGPGPSSESGKLSEAIEALMKRKKNTLELLQRTKVSTSHENVPISLE